MKIEDDFRRRDQLRPVYNLKKSLYRKIVFIGATGPTQASNSKYNRTSELWHILVARLGTSAIYL